MKRSLSILTHWCASALLVAAALIGTAMPALAQGLSIIRDTEIENLLMAYGRPVFIAGGLDPNTVTIRLIQDDSLNAFVTNGNNMFIHTGLLMAARNSNEVIGVMAHETGHIVGGHAVRFDEGMAKANTTALLTTLLGVAAGVLAKNPEVGMAVAMGGQGTALRQLLSYSRDQESSADQFAIKAMEETKQSPQGLYDFFHRIEGEELLSVERQDPYMRSHPLTRTRMGAIEEALQKSPYTSKPLDPAIEAQHRRMVAKLFSFLKPQIATLARYPDSDKSVEARYARATAYFRRGQTNIAIPLIDGLIAEYPKDPYFWELKGQMNLETGKMDAAVEAYRMSTTLLPNAPLNQVAMAHAMVESGKAEYAPEAQKALTSALAIDPEDTWSWDLLAKSYLQSDQPGLSAYAASERALLSGQFQDVIRYSKEAEKLLEKDTPTWYRLQDIRVAAQNQLQDYLAKRRRGPL